VPLFTSGALGLVIFGLGLVSSGLDLGLGLGLVTLVLVLVLGIWSCLHHWNAHTLSNILPLSIRTYNRIFPHYIQ